MDIGRPTSLAHSRISRQGHVGRYGIEQVVGLPQAMTSETAPAIVARLFDHIGAQRVGFNIPQHRQQVIVVLNHGALESPLPDMPAAAMEKVVALGMRYQKALHDAAD